MAPGSGESQGGWVMTGSTAPQPSPLRIAKFLDALTGGPYADAAERQAAERLGRMYPGARKKNLLPGGAAGEQLAAAEVLYGRAAVYAVTTGAGGVVFGNCGYRAVSPLHEAALKAAPQARFVYTDPDGRVNFYNRVKLAGGRVAACQASLSDPAGLMGHPEVRAITESGPVQLQAHFAAHWWPPDLARELVAQYAELLPSGSLLLLSLVIPDSGWPGAAFGSGVAEVAGATVYPHTPEDIAGWITGAGLKFVSRGVTAVRAHGRPWASALAKPRAPGRAVYAHARKP